MNEQILSLEKPIVKGTARDTILSISKARKEEYWNRIYREHTEREIKRKEEREKFKPQTREEYYKAGFLYGISTAVKELRLSKEDLEKFSDAHFEELEKIAYTMVQKEIWKYCGFFLIPLVGQIILLMMLVTYISSDYREYSNYEIRYWLFRRYTQKNGISLAKIIREYLLVQEKEKNQPIIKMIP